MKTLRRLVVSLDGTWNRRDDSTNVLYSHSLCADFHNREVNGVQVTQERYYQEGVGTGPLDAITGGGFGFGLDQHVRAAYDWLVQQYRDGGDSPENPPDEVYIFGFSRGAYTARSLVGFISMCGLLRRGAPLTVSQLWENYCILGLDREQRTGGMMDLVFGKPTPGFRRITDLAYDPWDRRAGKRVGPGERPRIRDGVTLSNTEDLLVRWSRRVKITYLGVFDTVGAMGWDALAIPGLRSRLAVQHNMRPTTIIQHCRHALALDENRSSFHHTPFVAFIGAPGTEAEADRGGIGEPAPPANLPGGDRPTDWRRVLAMWERKIEQRWFVGAHSNIGGGYPDNRLAQRPLEWILEGARQGGLVCEPFPQPPQVTPDLSRPTDSFAQFAPPLWTTILRAKRYYRRVDPPPEPRANRETNRPAEPPRPGFTLVHINEQVDESVWSYWRDASNPPPNLLEYASRQLKKKDATPSAAMAAVAARRTEGQWPGPGFLPVFALILWATLASAGISTTAPWFAAWTQNNAPLWLSCLAAAAFPWVDFLEHRLNLKHAREGASPFKRAFLDSIYWIRALGVLLFGMGLVGATGHVWSSGWNAGNTQAVHDSIAGLWGTWVPASLGAALSAAIACGLNGTLLRPPRSRLFGIAAAPVAVLVLIPAVILVAHICGHVLLQALGRSQSPPPPSIPPRATLGGHLLLLQLALAYFANALSWVDQPLIQAHLGRIIRLQIAFSAERVNACLDRWCRMLSVPHGVDGKACRMTNIVRLALWRDVTGFIPLYTAIFAFGLWYAAVPLEWNRTWPLLNTLWWLVPLVAAATDYLEDACHFHFLRQHDRGQPVRGVLPAVSTLLSLVKFLASSAAVLGILAAILCASGQMAMAPQDFGWRGVAALAITVLAALGTVVLGAWGIAYRLVNRNTRTLLRSAAPAPVPSAAAAGSE